MNLKDINEKVDGRRPKRLGWLLLGVFLGFCCVVLLAAVLTLKEAKKAAALTPTLITYPGAAQLSLPEQQLTPTTIPMAAAVAFPTLEEPAVESAVVADVVSPTPVPSEPEVEVIFDMATTKFGSLGDFYVDGDSAIVGFSVRGAVMQYTCTQNLGVFMSLDRNTDLMGTKGVDNKWIWKFSTGGEYYDAFIPCAPGKVLTFHTIHFVAHNQVHLVEVTSPLPASNEDILRMMIRDEKRKNGIMFDDSGTYTIIHPN